MEHGLQTWKPMEHGQHSNPKPTHQTRGTRHVRNPQASKRGAACEISLVHRDTPNYPEWTYTELRCLSFRCPQGRRQRQTLQRCKEKPLTFNKKLSHMDYRPGVRLCWVQTGVFVEQLTQHEQKVNDLLVQQSRVLKLQVLTV